MNPTYPLVPQVLRGVQRQLRRFDSPYRLVFFDSHAKAMSGGERAPSACERQVLEKILAEGFAGVIVWHSGSEDTLAVLKRMWSAGMVVVFVDRRPTTPDAPPCDFVGVDNRTGAHTAVSHLVEAGHRRIAHLTHRGTGVEDVALTVRERMEGYVDALRENGLPYSDDLVFGSEYNLIERVSAADAQSPTAVFAVNDTRARRLLQVAETRGVRIPQDLSVIGFDDLDPHLFPGSELASIRVPFDEIGERAAELLLWRLQQTPGATTDMVRNVLVPTALVPRATVAAIVAG